MARSPAKAPKRKRAATDVAEQAVVEACVPVADAATVAAQPDVVPASETAATPHVDAGAPVTLSANCSIKEVALLREQLSAVLDDAAPVVIDAGAVERIDTATLQLLFAFVRDRLASDREVSWQKVSPAVTDAARLLGVRDLLCLPAAS